MNFETMGTWAFFQNGVCTGVVFDGARYAMLLNLPAGQVAVPGPHSPGDPMPEGAEVIQSPKDQ